MELTSLMRIFEGEAIEDLEAVLCTTGETAIVLIERRVHN